MNGMARNAKKNIGRAFLLMEQYSQDKFQEILEKENLIDKYEDRLGTYLMQLTGKAMNVSQTKQVSKFLHTLSDFERLGDHAENIAWVAKELYEKKMEFSERAQYEIDILQSAVQEILDLTADAFYEDDINTAVKVEPLRNVISILCDELKSKHITRLRTGKCKLKQSFAFNDLLNNFERIAAHCSNIAVAMIELEAEDFGTHAYLRNVKGVKNAGYTRQFEEYEKKYDISKFKKSKKKLEARFGLSFFGRA